MKLKEWAEREGVAYVMARRFARFGAQDVAAALSARDRRLVAVDPSEVDDDLVRDVTEILACLCARAYGRRARASRAARAVEAITGESS